jgi:hypothetical protein
MESSNGNYPKAAESRDESPEQQPEEIVEFERATDPYANMLPGISNIRAARAIGDGMRVGRRGNRLIMAVSIFMLLALLLPLILTILDRLTQSGS